eukprot:GHVU01010809.1.p1 GENE.GHVU01010809.1~~GHVU01010809.1.p1  ORF type:complete len:910 (+),score=102.43 GHVU01010809.1:110-2839(+)
MTQITSTGGRAPHTANLDNTHIHDCNYDETQDESKVLTLANHFVSSFEGFDQPRGTSTPISPSPLLSRPDDLRADLPDGMAVDNHTKSLHSLGRNRVPNEASAVISTGHGLLPPRKKEQFSEMNLFCAYSSTPPSFDPSMPLTYIHRSAVLALPCPDVQVQIPPYPSPQVHIPIPPYPSPHTPTPTPSTAASAHEPTNLSSSSSPTALRAPARPQEKSANTQHTPKEFTQVAAKQIDNSELIQEVSKPADMQEPDEPFHPATLGDSALPSPPQKPQQPTIDNHLFGAAATPLCMRALEAAHRTLSPEFISKHTLQQRGNIWHHASGAIYIPEQFQEACCYYYHFSKYGLHQSAQKMLSRMRLLCWWPSINKYVNEYVAMCLACTRRMPLPARQTLGDLITTRPALIVAIDGYGPFVYRGVTYTALTIIDHYSKWAEVVAWPQTACVTARIIWAAFLRHWLALWGCPLELLSDNASILTSAYIEEQCSALNIHKRRSTSYHPQANGMIESWHRVLKRGLLSGQQHELTLSEALATTLFTYRTTPHDSTGQTPMYLHVGYDALLPGLQDLGLTQPQPPINERMNVLNEIRKLTWHTISSRVVARQTNKRQKAQHPALKVGDLVVCKWRPSELRWRNAMHGGPKLAPKWSEPRRIIEIHGRSQARLVVQSIWFNTPPNEMSLHDVRPIPAMPHPSALLANLKYIIHSLENHCVLTPRTPSPLPISQALLNHLREPQHENRTLAQVESVAGSAATASEKALWPVHAACVQEGKEAHTKASIIPSSMLGQASSKKEARPARAESGQEETLKEMLKLHTNKPVVQAPSPYHSPLFPNLERLSQRQRTTPEEAAQASSSQAENLKDSSIQGKKAAMNSETFPSPFLPFPDKPNYTHESSQKAPKLARVEATFSFSW